MEIEDQIYIILLAYRGSTTKYDVCEPTETLGPSKEYHRAFKELIANENELQIQLSTNEVPKIKEEKIRNDLSDTPADYWQLCC